MNHHLHHSYTNSELVRIHSLNDNPLVRLLADRLDQVDGELRELEAADTEIVKEKDMCIDDLEKQVKSLNIEIESLYEKHNL